MNLKQGAVIALISLMIIGAAGVATAGETRTITDMVGRTVIVPAEIDSVLGTSPPTTEAVYMLDPDLLSGLNFAFNSTRYVPDEYRSLPDLGGQQMGKTLNYETFLSIHPDIILFGTTPYHDVVSTIDDLQTKLNPVPVVGVIDTTNARDYGPGITFLGELLDRKEEAAELNTFYETVYQTVTGRVDAIPEEERIRVYYAEGPDGLKTDPESSDHAQLISLCGGRNVADVSESGGGGMTPVSLEQVIAWNPDVILAGDSRFYESVLSDPDWKDITAVREHRIYLIPNQPFGWIDRPPGVNRIIGIPWLAKVLYPDLFTDLDLNGLITRFYSRFYHYELTPDEVTGIITGSGLPSP